MSDRLSASIIIPTFNGGKTLDKVLNAVMAQKQRLIKEVLIIDSGSTDTTIEIAKKYNVKLIVIDKDKFSHGDTRNYGASITSGEIIVYLTQDSIPQNDLWLENLVYHFRRHSRIACVFGPHVTDSNANLLLEWELKTHFNNFLYGNHNYTVQGLEIPKKFKNNAKQPAYKSNKMWYYFNSNVNSALRRSYWKRYHFKKVNYAEDLLMGRSVIENGYLKVYESRARVIHYHDYGLIKYAKRIFDEHRALKLLNLLDLSIDPASLFKNILRETYAKLKFIMSFRPTFKTLSLSSKAILQAVVKFIVIVVFIKNINCLPAKLQQSLSLERRSNFIC